MESKIKIFENEEFGSMRTLEESGKVFFCGKDAATALGYRDTVNAIKAHCKEDGGGELELLTNLVFLSAMDRIKC